MLEGKSKKTNLSYCYSQELPRVQTLGGHKAFLALFILILEATLYTQKHIESLISPIYIPFSIKKLNKTSDISLPLGNVIPQP